MRNVGRVATGSCLRLQARGSTFNDNLARKLQLALGLLANLMAVQSIVLLIVVLVLVSRSRNLGK